MCDRTQATGTNAVAIGLLTTASGSATFTGGISTTASGYASVALGSNSTASGNYTFSSGFFAKAAGFAATALGANTFANGNNSVSMGNRTAALAHRSVALGEYTIANHFTEMVLGVYNDTVNGNYNASSLPSDRLFTIGNGTDTNNRSHAITVLKNGRTAIGNITPQERLHVGGQVRIDTLLSGSPSDSIVTVGANGVLHKRNIASLGAGGAGDYCTNNPSALTGDYEIPLGNFNYYFTGQASDSITDSNMSSSVGIGLNCGDPIPSAKLHVRQLVSNPYNNDISIAGQFENYASSTASFGMYTEAFSESLHNVGGYFMAKSVEVDADQTAVGVYALATDAIALNIGVYGEAYTGDENYGVRGVSGNGTKNYGVYGEIVGFGRGYAIYGKVDTSFGNYAGFFDGPVEVTGTFTNQTVCSK